MHFFSTKILYIAYAISLVSVLFVNVSYAQEITDENLIFLREIPHSEEAFTQGLEVDDLGMLIESTGQYGRSSLRKVNSLTGAIEIIRPIQPTFFAEGLTRINGKIFLATWRNGLILEFDESSYNLESSLRFDGEGWGLTNNGVEIILSDGSDVLKFYNPDGMRLVRSISVREQGQTIGNVNELEYINGEIWANLWHEDDVIRIDPDTGNVIQRFRPSKLLPRNLRSSEAVFNGIAYDSRQKLIYLTGKYWPSYYIYQLVQ
jgi:glutamine cyclotransferase